ncbi:MAG: isopentenyl-diphosphate Delta-isomerase [Flavobacteriaceae bacterium]|jgi:isopentenyl-diphosphate delta-isomerase|nr:isopentenyl-diphosphate Delta-isomerase [Flavobacteriaceae bacterium]MCI5089021.1 isopentenyl-diphosphate Delta-isomerase [Flavobacteriaceae bacterium]CAI8215055.1 MAG: Isopentenyl-diphosphate Delta-isomerase [SAR116 cluster bacterium]
MKEFVVLVNEQDEPLGLMEKIEAHEKAVLHRAFSVFIKNGKGEIMLQQRALDKYHSPGLWTNTCCSHQRDGEAHLAAGKRRLQEEMGFEAPLEHLFSFIYKADMGNGLTEHELDHVLQGTYEGEPILNPLEAANWKWMLPEDVKKDIQNHPDTYTPWFKIIFEKYYAYLS